MASANPRGDLMLDETTNLVEDIYRHLSEEEMQALHTQFAKEAFAFLLQNAKISNENIGDFLTKLTNPLEDIVFTTFVGKAIITIAYIFRLKYRKDFRKFIHLLKDPAIFETYVTSYTFPKGKMYFYNYLSWVAFVFELAVYCYTKGYNYFERGVKCIASYKDIKYFISQGGWHNLTEYSKCIAEFYDIMKPIISKESPTDEIIVPFIKAVENMEIEIKKNKRDFSGTPEMQQLIKIKKLSKTHAGVPRLDSQDSTSGYEVTQEPSNTLQKDSSKSSKESLPEIQISFPNKNYLLDYLTSQMKNIRLADHTGRESPRTKSPPVDTIHSKFAFIISERFFNEKMASFKDQEHKCGLEVHSPSEKIKKADTNFDEILNENLKSGSYSKEGGVYAVLPPGSKIHDEDIQLLFGGFTEEEQNSCNEFIVKFIQKLLSTDRDCTRSESRVPHEVKCTTVVLPVRLERVSSKITACQSEKSCTDVPLEKKSFAATKSTGAICKVRKNDSKKSPIKERVANSESCNLQDSDINSKSGQSTSKQKSKKKKKKSKK